MEILNKSLKLRFFFKIGFLIVISLLIFLSLKNLIFFSDSKIQYLIILILFEIIFILWIFKNNVFYSNISFIILLNLIITPLFFESSFKVPYRQPNTKSLIHWDKDLKNGFTFSNHTISTDSKGNRVNKKIEYELTPSDNLRVFTIGASTTEEQGLDDSIIWSNNLIKLLKANKFKNKNNYEIINFGISGTRTIHHYFTFKNNLELKPSLVIFLVGVNDWNYHIVNSKEDFIFSKFEIQFSYDSSLLHKVFSKVYRAGKKAFNFNKETVIISEENYVKNPYKHLIEKNIKLKNEISNFTKIDIQNVSPRYSYWLNKIMILCNKKKINCLFVDQPSLYSLINIDNFDQKIWMNPPFENFKVSFNDMINIKNIYNEYLEKNSFKNNLKFCKLSSKINPKFINFIDDVHFSPLGSKKVANEIYNCIDELFN